jgi:hypothetical protein
MAISYQEHAELTCPSCSTDFAADMWLVLDAEEHPEAVDSLRNGTLNTVICPSCGYSGPAGAPLLYHDGRLRKVIFAPAPGSAEHELREQARDLHALLVGSIPEEQRRPYLADVDIAQDLAGVGRLIERYERRRGKQGTGGQGAEGKAQEAGPQGAGGRAQEAGGRGQEAGGRAQEADPSVLLAAIEALLSADTPEEFQAVLANYAVLREPATDEALAQLAEVAANQREPDIAASLTQARRLLAGLAPVEAPEEYQGVAGPPLLAPAEAEVEALPEAALQLLLASINATELAQAVERYPILLVPEADGLLAGLIDRALDQGNERYAAALEDRREGLLALREARGKGLEADEGAIDEPTMDEAIEALLLADGEAAIRAVVERYPILRAEAAAKALWQFAAEARASGDEELAVYAIECREMIRRMKF